MHRINQSLVHRICMGIGLGVVGVISITFSAQAGEVVTTYVTRVQSERESTRFTLTEWLLIKERMKMMDLWLAMFGDNKQQNFQPEFYLSYAQTQGIAASKTNLAAKGIAVQGTSIDSQLWLTNLISSTTRLRTVNIDFGFGMRMDSASQVGSAILQGDLSPQTAAPGQSQVAAITSENKSGAFSRRQDSMFNLRLFGKSIQDSSLVVGYGIYDAARASSEVASSSENLQEASGMNLEEKGNKASGELQIYLSNWLGMQGNYENLVGKVSAKNLKTNHTYYDYGIFLEISLLRLGGSVYFENRNYEEQDKSRHEVNEAGVKTSVKLQF